MLQEKDGVSDFRTAAYLVVIEKIRLSDKATLSETP